MRTAYGIDIQRNNDPHITTAEHATQAIAASSNAGSYLVDTLPICKHTIFFIRKNIEQIIDCSRVVKYVPAWFPGAGFQKEARGWSQSVDKMREEPWKETKKRMVMLPMG